MKKISLFILLFLSLLSLSQQHLLSRMFPFGIGHTQSKPNLSSASSAVQPNEVPSKQLVGKPRNMKHLKMGGERKKMVKIYIEPDAFKPKVLRNDFSKRF